MLASWRLAAPPRGGPRAPVAQTPRLRAAPARRRVTARVGRYNSYEEPLPPPQQAPAAAEADTAAQLAVQAAQLAEARLNESRLNEAVAATAGARIDLARSQTRERELNEQVLSLQMQLVGLQREVDRAALAAAAQARLRGA
jgi:hypothetical protein